MVEIVARLGRHLCVPLFLLAGLAAMPANAQQPDAAKPSIYEKPTVVNGLVKVCKVGRVARMVGELFEFADTQGLNKFVVPAGPMPGGYCVFGRVPYPVGSKVTIVETPTFGVKTTDIAVAPGGRLVAKDTDRNSATIEIGIGVVEITFYQTEIERGWLEVCKVGDGLSGNAIFSIDGMPGTFTVPVGACSPAAYVPSGQIVIREVQPPPGAVWSNGGCRTIPANRQVACDDSAHTSTVQIVGGDISVQTIAIITDRPGGSSTVYDPNRPAGPGSGPTPPDNGGQSQTPVEQPR